MFSRLSRQILNVFGFASQHKKITGDTINQSAPITMESAVVQKESIGQRSARKAKEAYEIIKNILPETEDIAIDGKDYTINYKQFLLPEDCSPVGYNYKDGRPVEDHDEKQLIIDEIYDRIYEALNTTKKHNNG